MKTSGRFRLFLSASSLYKVLLNKDNFVFSTKFPESCRGVELSSASVVSPSDAVFGTGSVATVGLNLFDGEPELFLSPLLLILIAPIH